MCSKQIIKILINKLSNKYMFMIENLPGRLLNILCTFSVRPVSRSVLNVMLEWFKINHKDPRKPSIQLVLMFSFLFGTDLFKCDVLYKLLSFVQFKKHRKAPIEECYFLSSCRLKHKIVSNIQPISHTFLFNLLAPDVH